jgi:hypothetical protein
MALYYFAPPDLPLAWEGTSRSRRLANNEVIYCI